MKNIEKIKKEILENFQNEIKNLSQEDKILKIKSNYLGSTGILNKKLISKIKDLSHTEKIIYGKCSNEIKKIIEQKISLLMEKIKLKKINKEFELTNNTDKSLPGSNFNVGTVHILNQLIKNIYNFFKFNNFAFFSGKEIDTLDYNFDKLNIPKDHPARNEDDTFYINEKFLLRTQCTNVTSYMLEQNNKKSDIRIVSVGNVYRRDTNDATHSHQFMQIDGVCVGKKHNLLDLKFLLKSFCKYIFGKKTEIRLRPSFFPFTSISLEVDVSCSNCEQAGCFLCKNTGWIEIMGAGMLHPNVLKKTNNLKHKQGFAFGIGIERIAMIKYKINDIRHFYNNDLRFIAQFKLIWGKNDS